MIKTFENFIQEDPYGEEIWNEKEDLENEVDILGEPMFRNYYKCSECGTEWNDVWDATCDDACPNCAEIMSPIESEDVFESVDDPYGEENWEDKPDPRLKFKVGDRVYCTTNDNIYTIIRAYVSEYDERLYDVDDGEGEIGIGIFEDELDWI